MAAKLYRVVIPTENLERAIAFYAGLFAEGGERVAEDWHYFRFGEVTLALHRVLTRGLHDSHGEPFYIAVDVPALNLFARARQLGGTDLDPEIHQLPTGERGFQVRDPDGNCLCIVEAQTMGWRPVPPAAAPPRPAGAVVMSLQRDFINAVKGGELQRVKDLMMLDHDLCYSADGTGVTAMMLALYKRHTAVAQFLLAQHEHVSVWEAAAMGLDDRLAAILTARPDLVTAYSVDGFTPLGLACFFGHPANVSLLLARGADVHAPTRNAMKVQPIHSALSHDDPVVASIVVRSLLAAGADINARREGGNTPLHQAADRGNLLLIELLLEEGADRAARADNGRTPADVALAKGYRHIAVALGLRTEPA